MENVFLQCNTFSKTRTSHYLDTIDYIFCKYIIDFLLNVTFLNASFLNCLYFSLERTVLQYVQSVKENKEHTILF